MHRLCSIEDIPDGDAIGVATPEGEIMLVRQGREIFAYRNSCPHLGIELNFMPDEFLDTDKRYIHCINHGALFQIEDGLCVFGPCNGQSLTPVPLKAIGDVLWLESSPSS